MPKPPLIKHIILLVFTLLVVLFFITYSGMLSHITYYHEQHHLFLFSKSYFTSTIHSGGLLDYITNFIIQFFYYSWLGSLLMALLLASVYLLIAFSAQRISGKTDFLQLGLLPVIYLFIKALSVDYNVSFIVAWLFPLSVIAVSVSVFSGRLKYIIAVAGCLALLTFVPWKIITFAIIATSLSATSAHFLRNRKIKHHIVITLLAIISYSGAGYYFLSNHYQVGEKYMVLVKKNANEGKWEETIYMANRYISSGRKNVLMLYYRNIALFHTGRLADNMFNVPQVFGTTSLCFPWRSNSRETEYGFDAYYELEHWNAAQRCCSRRLPKRCRADLSAAASGS